jgi:D-amino-acid dehydrogenase
MPNVDAAHGRVAVVGAGLIGLFSAHYLVERGHDVTLLEPSDRTGGGASRVNAGWVCPARSDPLPSSAVVRDGLRSLVSRHGGGFFLGPAALPHICGFLMRFLSHSSRSTHARSWNDLDVLNARTPGLIDELTERGIIADLRDEGFLSLHTSREEAERARAALVAVSHRGLSKAPESLVGREALLDLEPGLGAAATWGFLHFGDRWLDPSRLVDALTESLLARGARVVTHARVTSVRQRGSTVELEAADGAIEATHAVIAAGAWSEHLLRPLGIRGYVTPGKGYSFTAHPQQPVRHVLRLGHTHVGVTPLRTGARLVGVVEMDGTFEVLRPDRIEHMKREAAPYLSGIDWDSCTDHHVAPRPMTPDGKPLIGPVPGSERVIVATGHNMLGLSLGAATGAIVADLIELGPGAAPVAFEPTRFSPRRARRR